MPPSLASPIPAVRPIVAPSVAPSAGPEFPTRELAEKAFFELLKETVSSICYTLEFFFFLKLTIC